MATTKKTAAKKTEKKVTTTKKTDSVKKVTTSKKADSAAKVATSAKKTATKKEVAKTVAKKTPSKRTPNAAFMKPVTPSVALSAIVGKKPIPRTEVTKKVWAYIKKNNLQDASNRTMINADDKLKLIFGEHKQVSMFELTKLVSNNLS